VNEHETLSRDVSEKPKETKFEFEATMADDGAMKEESTKDWTEQSKTRL
jgi:hypothetical protein